MHVDEYRTMQVNATPDDEPPGPFLTFSIPIAPAPKSRPRFTRSGGVYTDSKTAAYEQAVGLFARRAMAGQPRNDFDDLYVEVTFRLATRQRRDLDNLIKALLDALNMVVWKDDMQVTEIRARAIRESPDPGADVRVGVVLDRHVSCVHCLEPLTRIQVALRGRYCSVSCYDLAQRRGAVQECSGCGGPVYRQAGKTNAANTWCSPECRAKHRPPCRQCGEPLPTGHYLAECSEACRRAWAQAHPPKFPGGTCVDCGVPVSRKAGRCRPCSRQAAIGGRPSALPSSGAISRCECGNVKNRKSQRCNECFRKGLRDGTAGRWKRSA